MLVLDLPSKWKREKNNNLLEKSFVARELGLLLFPALEKTAHAYLRQSSAYDVLRIWVALSLLLLYCITEMYEDQTYFLQESHTWHPLGHTRVALAVIRTVLLAT